MLYVHGVENGHSDCGLANVVNKNCLPNSISSLILTHNQTAAFNHHPQLGDSVQPSMNNNGHWIGNVTVPENSSDLAANEVNQKNHFGGGSGSDLNIYTRDPFCSQKETDNVRGFSVNKLLQINNRSGNDSGM